MFKKYTAQKMKFFIKYLETEYLVTFTEKILKGTLMQI